MKRNLIFISFVPFVAILLFASPAAAMYHPALGRFIQRDGEQYVDGMNLYQYVRSSPCVYTDSEGQAAATAGVIIAGSALGYTVAHDAVKASVPDVSWHLDALKGTVFVSDKKKTLKKGWRHGECEIKFEAQAKAALGVVFQWEVSWWYHNEGHVSQVTLTKTHADDSLCWALDVDVDIVVVPGNWQWGKSPPLKDLKTGQWIGRVVELKATYSVSHTFASDQTVNSRWNVTGDGTIYRRRIFRRGGKHHYCESLLNCKFGAN